MEHLADREVGGRRSGATGQRAGHSGRSAGALRPYVPGPGHRAATPDGLRWASTDLGTMRQALSTPSALRTVHRQQDWGSRRWRPWDYRARPAAG